MTEVAVNIEEAGQVTKLHGDLSEHIKITDIFMMRSITSWWKEVSNYLHTDCGEDW